MPDTKIQVPRFELDLRKQGVASVPAFGRYRYSKAMPGLAAHRHRDAMEICFLVRGRQLYEVGGRQYALRGGDLFITLPGETHSTGGEPEQKGYLYWVSLLHPSRTGDSLLGLSKADSLALWKNLQEIVLFGHRHFPANPQIKNQLDAVAGHLSEPRSILRRIAVLNRLTAFLLGVVASFHPTENRRSSSRLKHVFGAIRDNLENPEQLTIEKLAALTALSPSRFQATFKKETGLPPAEYVLRARVAEAGRRLGKPGTNITKVAVDLGFSSSQYFSVIYKRFTGRRPSDDLSRKRFA